MILCRLPLFLFKARRLLRTVAVLFAAALVVKAAAPRFARSSPLILEATFAIAVLALFATQPAAPEGDEPSRQPISWPHAAALLALAGAAFYGAQSLYFIGDDYFVVLDTLQGRGSQFFPSLATRTHEFCFRPVGYTLLYLQSLWTAADPVRWHGASLAIHLVNSALLGAVGASLGLPAVSAAFAAAIFAIHGSRPESAVWITGHFELTSAAFFLAALLLVLRAKAGWKTPHRAAALVLFLLAIWCKESAYALPLVLLALPRRAAESWRGRITASAPFFALAAVAFVHRWHILSGPGGYIDPASGSSETANFQIWRLGKLLGARLWAVLFFPINWTRVPEWPLVLALAGMAAALIYAATRGRRDSVFVFGLIAAVLCALPASSQLLIGADLQKSRLLYLPSAGFALCLAAALRRLPNPRACLLSAGAVLLFQVCALRHNLIPWQQVAAISRSACDDARRLAVSPGRQVAVIGAPGSIQGVYFFQNGLDACLALGDGGYWTVRQIPPGSPPPDGFAGDILRWNPAAETFVR